MVFATVEGEDPAAEALRRLGHDADRDQVLADRGHRYFERTGRQVEIVEVKGSVELAPLTGMVDGIVDLTATGTTLRENGLVVREEIMDSTARLIANPVSYRDQGGGDRRRRGAPACGLSTRPTSPPQIRAAVPAGDVGGGRRRGDHRRRARARRRGAARVRGALRERRDARARARAAAEGARRGARHRPRRARSRGPRGLEVAIANVRAVAEAGLDDDRAVTLPEGQTVTLREVPVRRAAIYAPSGRHPYPSHGRDGRDHRPRRRRRRGLPRHRAASRPARRRAPVRGRRRLPRHRRAGRSPRSPTAPSRSRAST